MLSASQLWSGNYTSLISWLLSHTFVIYPCCDLLLLQNLSFTISILQQYNALCYHALPRLTSLPPIMTALPCPPCSTLSCPVGVSCLFALGVNISNYLVLGQTSPLTYQVLGHLKTVLIIVLGFLVFKVTLFIPFYRCFSKFECIFTQRSNDHQHT